MTPAEIDRVFGAGRLQMATGGHVEVFREAVEHGVERRYTKRFLAAATGDFRPWSEREWHILQRLTRHGAPVAKPLALLPGDDRGAAGLQTRDAGATVEQWATLVPLRRDGTALRSVFEDCAHWWSLARHCLLALDVVHALGFVHLELKADNVCIPWAPAGAGRPVPGQPLRPRFKALALIDVAFSLLPEVDFAMPLPLLRQPAFEYQSPRLLHALEEGRRGQLRATRALDWRCDFFSLAGMLWRYLPELDHLPSSGWTTQRHLQASEFVQHLLDLHSAAMPAQWPHRELIDFATERLRDPELAAALEAGTSFDPERKTPLAAAATPPTRLAVTATPLVPAPTPTSAPISTPVEARDDAGSTAAAAPTPRPQADGAAGDAGGSSGAGSDTPSEAAGGTTSGTASGAPTGTSGAASATNGAAHGTGREAAGDAAAAPASPLAPPADAAAAPAAEASESNKGEANPSEAVAEAKTGARPPLRAHRASARRRLAQRIALGVAVVGVAAIAWWVSREQAARIEMPSLADVADRRVLPASAATRPSAGAPVTPPARTAPAGSDSAAALARSESAPALARTESAPALARSEPAPAPARAAAPAPNAPLEMQAEAWRRERLPAVAAAAERHLARVLTVAADSAEFRRRGNVRAAARAMRAASPPAPREAGAEQAGTLNDAALVAYGSSNDVGEALALQTQAFGANPFDSEVAGNLAFLHLKEQPPRVEAARQLALHALTLNDVRFPTGRTEDWTTLAIADALTGRDVDARNAWYVALALTGDLHRLCSAAVGAEARYGDLMRPSVQALLQRMRSSAAYGRCEVAGTEPKRVAKPEGKAAPQRRRAIP